MKKPIRTVIYRCARNIEPNLDKQKDDLIAYAQDADLKVIGDFSDNAAVYKLDDRLQLRQLIRAARRREFDCVGLRRTKGRIVSHNNVIVLSL